MQRSCARPGHLMARLGSIRTKFILTVCGSVMIAQVIEAGVSVWQEATLYAQTKQETMLSTAQAIAAAVAHPTATGDEQAAFRALRAIGGIPGASYVRVEDKNGRTIAESGQAEQLESDVIETERGKVIDQLKLIGSRTLEVAVPVVESGERVGRLVLIGDVSDLAQRIIGALKLTGLGALGALALAVTIALRMLGPMTKPLVDLAAVMSRVRRNHDYSVSMTSPRKDEIGVLIRGFDTMISEIRHRTEELARHRDQLEQEVADRTADYRRATEAAEDANKAKSDFLATMSHEIRTPMNGVMVMAELLAASDLPPRARKNADVIVRSGQTLIAIINDILDLSKIEAGKLEVETMTIDPVEATEDVMRLFGDRAQSKNLDLASLVRLPRGVKVDADPVRLTQVLSNLVNNALKFTEQGGVTVEIGPDPELLSHVRFIVADTGIGIAEDKLDGIFGAFTQADQSTTRKFGGTGLGLAIAKKLVTAMGGDLRVASAAGAGARFYFSLPLSSASQPAQRARIASATPARAVVCVEGASSADHLVLALREAGFAVACANAVELAAAAQGARIVFADAATLASLPERLEAGAVVAVAGLGETPDELLAEKRADALIQRPIPRDETDAILDAVIENRAFVVAATTQKAPDLPKFPQARILVVDDGAVNREVAGEALRRLGIEADMANDGREAVEAVERKTYDLVFMDGSMPVMDGYEATRAIRAREVETGRTRMKIVALTAHVVGAGAEAWRQSGMDGVLHKPFTLAAMADCLAAHIGGGETAAAVAIEAPAAPAADAAIDPRVIEGLREMSGGDNAAVLRIVSLYRSHAPRSVDAIEAAFAAQDREALATAAHALKSMSANIGATAVAGATLAIERACRIDMRMPEREMVDAVRPLVAGACEAVQRFAEPSAQRGAA
jgi:two-component system sensor histidine kinase BarA